MTERLKAVKIAAVDPGLKGGIAILYEEGDIYAIPMPTAGKEIDLAKVSAILKDADPSWLVIEKVHSMPTQGVASTFRFGMGYGAIQGIAAALSISMELVTPQCWKGKILKGTAKDKDAAIAYCRRAFPLVELIPPRCRKPHDGIAEALCLMEYGRRELLREEAA